MRAPLVFSLVKNRADLSFKLASVVKDSNVNVFELTIPARVTFWFFKFPGWSSEGNSLEDIHGTEESKANTLTLNPAPLCLHSPQLNTVKPSVLMELNMEINTLN